MMWGWHLFWPMHWFGWGVFGVLGGLGRALFIVGAIVAVVVVFARRSRSRMDGPTDTHGESAVQILKRRYASGEIGKEEYEQKLRDLGGGA